MIFITLTFNPTCRTLFFSGFLCPVALLRLGRTTDGAFSFAKARLDSPVGESSVRVVSEGFLAAVRLYTSNPVREEVWSVDGVILRMARSKLEDEIE